MWMAFKQTPYSFRRWTFFALPASFAAFLLKWLFYGVPMTHDQNILLTPIGLFVGLSNDTFDWGNEVPFFNLVITARIASILFVVLSLMVWLTYGSPSTAARSNPMFMGPISQISPSWLATSCVIFAVCCKHRIEVEKASRKKVTV